MSKPRELAEQYAKTNRAHLADSLNKAVGIKADIMTFLAGYQAAALQWISVKDRMPEKDQTVLIYTDEKDIYMARIYEDGEAWPVSNSCGCCGTEEKFTHWMPLPEPPKEEA